MKNLGSKILNDCVPTTFVEADNYLGGNTSYEEFKTLTNYQDEVGTLVDKNGYENLLSKSFNKSSINTDVLSNPELVSQIKNSGGLISTNMPYNLIRHADNIRSISYYSNKIVLNLRIGSYRLAGVNNKWWFYFLRGIKK